MSQDDDRKQRLAQALRDNLRRRKGQAREANATPLQSNRQPDRDPDADE
ncbi:hypothetical protein [Sphingobium algorifonticola]|nr:hypothetical protein [Sphingobium algorifonticola]